jgi:hypothetical protein
MTSKAINPICYNCDADIKGQADLFWYSVEMEGETLMVCHECSDRLIREGLAPRFLYDMYQKELESNIKLFTICNSQKKQIEDLEAKINSS